MKILHLCLACFYIDGYNYQENVLPRINANDGHEVQIIASTETYLDNLQLGYIEPKEYINEDGIKVIRLPFKNLINKTLTVKVRVYPGLYERIEEFCPDVIMAHDLAFWSVLDVIRYKKNHSYVKFYADTHTAIYNSGRNWISLHIQHRLLYKQLIHKALPFLEKYFYIAEKEKEFSIQNYNVPEDLMEFYPLGGIIPSDEEYKFNRELFRSKLRIKDDELLFVHTGKLDALKKTDMLLNAFWAVKSDRIKLIIIGSIPEYLEEQYSTLIERDNRVHYLGWKNSKELTDILCATDLYCQPGSVSATLQNAICCFNPIMSFPHSGYFDLDYKNFIWVENEKDITNSINKILSGEIDLKQMKDNSVKCARELLDYRKLASRIYV